MSGSGESWAECGGCALLSSGASSFAFRIAVSVTAPNGIHIRTRGLCSRCARDEDAVLHWLASGKKPRWEETEMAEAGVIARTLSPGICMRCDASLEEISLGLCEDCSESIRSAEEELLWQAQLEAMDREVNVGESKGTEW